MRQYVPSSSTDTQRDIHSTELGAISVCVCCRTVGKSSDLQALGRCVGDAWEVHGGCMGPCMMDSSSCHGYTYYGAVSAYHGATYYSMAHMTERVSMPELSAQAVLLKVCCG